MSNWREDVLETLLDTRERWARQELSVVDMLALEKELSPTEEELAEVRRREVAAHVRPRLRVVRDDDRV